ncbi:hypothetical protein Zmor_017544 [Zophobas morio]|uniref:Uncharacterized protein n=1 Tax=Zophobas morio TaxID=2755281 RepID=A0AA38ICD0_9CUCU|nr:hypothetical protein Zmor_017544 [Zophobas morio]
MRNGNFNNHSKLNFQFLPETTKNFHSNKSSIETHRSRRLVDLSLCGDLHAARGDAFGQDRRSLGRQLTLRGREHRGCSQAGDTDFRW